MTQITTITKSLVEASQTIHNQGTGIKINHIIKPFSFIPCEKFTMSPYRRVKLECLGLLKSKNYEGLRVQIPFLEGLDKEAVLQTLLMYDSPHDEESLQWSSQLTQQQLKGDLSYLDERVDRLYKSAMDPESYRIESRESGGHSSSFSLLDTTSGKTLAILKQSGYYRGSELIVRGSSFDRLNIPGLAITSPSYELELIGYEQDQLFGFSHTPATLAVRFVNERGQEVLGVLQEFIDHAKAGSELHNPIGAKQIQNYSKSHVHRVAMSSIFKGLSAAHRDNYMFADKIYEIDLEEMLLPYNCLDRELRERSIILGRMWILGFPQSGLPFDRDNLLAICHPSLPSLLERYQNEASKYTEISNESWTAQRERLKKMQDLARSQLDQPVITLTPRDMFFEIFGGRHLFGLSQQKGYPAQLAFTQVVSDPYQHTIKDFEHPENIAECSWLDPQSGKSPEIVRFFRILAGLEAA